MQLSIPVSIFKGIIINQHQSTCMSFMPQWAAETLFLEKQIKSFTTKLK